MCFFFCSLFEIPGINKNKVVFFFILGLYQRSQAIVPFLFQPDISIAYLHN